MTAGPMRRVAWWLLVVALSVSTLAAASVGGWQMVTKSQQRPPLAEQAAARQAVTQAASTGTVKLLSYSPDTLDRDFSAARAFLTGDFLAYYDQFCNQIVRPAAQEKRLTTTATVQRAGVESLTEDTAVVLVFVNQTTTSKENPSPSLAASSVLVSMAKVNGTWLINKFNPV